MTPLRHLGRVLPALVLLGACDLPTAAPKWDTKWNVPGKTTTISVASLLPSGVTVASDSNAFLVNVDSMVVSRSLSQDCGACAATNGMYVPKPAFTIAQSDSTTVVAELQSASIDADTLVLTVTNGFPFDILRPSADTTQPTGTFSVRVTSGPDTVAAQTVDGATQAMPGGGAVTVIRVPMSGTVTGTQPLVFDLSLNSPQGDSVQMDSSARISVSARVSSGTLNQFRITGVTVRLTNQPINADPTSIDLSSIDSSVVDRVLGGQIQLTIGNPFGVLGSATANFSNTGAGTISKTFSLTSQPTSTVDIDFNQTDLRALLGHNVGLALTGSVCPASCNVSISPKQVVSVTSRLEMTISSEKTP